MNYVGNEPAPGGLVLVGDTNPVGLIGWFHGVPDGSWLVMNGQVVSKTTYPDLWTYAQGFLTVNQVGNPGLYLDVSGSTFAVPKLDGLFIRAQGNAGTAPQASGPLGQKQGDAIGEHAHFISNVAYSSGVAGVAGTNTQSNANNAATTNTINVGIENRPVNVALIPCVKALKSVIIPASAMPQQSTQLLQTQVAANVAQLDFTNLVGYPGYRFIFRNVVPVTDVQNLQFRISSDNGVTFDATANYVMAISGVDSSGTAISNTSAATAAAVIAGSVSNAAVYGATGDMITGDLTANAARRQQFVSQMMFHRTSGGPSHMNGGSAYALTNVNVNALRFFFNAGNIATGSISAYGLRG